MNNKKLSTDIGIKLLKEKGFKITPSRLEIISVFINNQKPMDVSFVFNKLKNKFNEVTVYRTIYSFEKCGILRKVDLRKDSVFFEFNEDHHHHIVCLNCGEIEDFKENKDIEKILEKVIGESKKFKNIKEHSLELFGYCKFCI